MDRLIHAAGSLSSQWNLGPVARAGAPSVPGDPGSSSFPTGGTSVATEGAPLFDGVGVGLTSDFQG